MSALKWFFFATHVYLRGNLRVRLTTQRKSLPKFNLRPLATTCHSVWPGLKMSFLRFTSICEETCESVWPPNASLYASSTCIHLRLLAGPFGQGLSKHNNSDNYDLANRSLMNYLNDTRQKLQIVHVNSTANWFLKTWILKIWWIVKLRY